MGLLTDPSAGQSKIIQVLMKYYSKLCVLLYTGGVIYFCLLAYRPLNGATYFSENALLPGLVKSEFRDDNTAHVFYRELMDEMEKYDNSIPYPWILAKFNQIGLDTYTHNFTLNYPLGKSQKFTGKNVYGILRGARAASTEALVLSVPYRPPTSMHQTTAPSIAVMLAFAKFANKEKYWAKDIIFLVTEHEQLGMQAWLEAYHGISCGKKGILLSGDMKGRSGAIQAAINLEIHSTEIGQIDIKIEGLNGQLPNLDLVNLAARMCVKENIPHTFKNRLPKRFSAPYKDWRYAFHTLMSMASTQATGIPNGNHGLFYRFGIQALTLEGFAPEYRSKYGFLTIGRIIEEIFRSLNNLLERFHQSFFFYLLSSTDRYISIGLYMPAIAALAATLFIKGYAKWCELHENTTDEEVENNENVQSHTEKVKPPPKSDLTLAEWQKMFEKEISQPSDSSEISFGHISLVFVLAHIMGFVLKDIPKVFTIIGAHYGIQADLSVFVGFGLASFLMIVSPILIKKPCYQSMVVLNIFALLELGTTLICVAMYNISLAMFCAVFYVPFALLISPTKCRLCSCIQKSFWLLLHPFIFIIITVFIYTYVTFLTEPFLEVFLKGVDATQQAIMFSIVDSMIYGNWLFSVICTIFTSNWFCFWYMSWYVPKPDEMCSKDVVPKAKQE